MGINFKSKYVVGKVDCGHPLGEVMAAVVFQDPLTHFDVAKKMMVEGSVVGAGFCRVYIENEAAHVTTYGESVTLKIKSRDEDLKYVQRALSLEENR